MLNRILLAVFMLLVFAVAYSALFREPAADMTIVDPEPEGFELTVVPDVVRPKEPSNTQRTFAFHVPGEHKVTQAVRVYHYGEFDSQRSFQVVSAATGIARLDVICTLGYGPREAVAPARARPAPSGHEVMLLGLVCDPDLRRVELPPDSIIGFRALEGGMLRLGTTHPVIAMTLGQPRIEQPETGGHTWDSDPVHAAWYAVHTVRVDAMTPEDRKRMAVPGASNIYSTIYSTPDDSPVPRL